jgi:hypothetical protein
MMRTLAVALIFLGLNIALTGAASPGDAIKEFGLIGTWAVHCDKPISKDNVFVTYELKDDTAQRITRTSMQDASTAAILGARIIDGVHLQQSWKLREFTFDQIIEMKAGKYRLIVSKGGDGNVYYADGRSTGDGSETPWLEKCPQLPVIH